MALQLSIDQSNVGVPFQAAYARITTINGTKDRVSYMVSSYYSQEARQANAQHVMLTHFDAEMPTGTLLEGLYAHLKTQPGFENAIDV